MKRKILVVEDHPDNREILCIFLRGMGYEVLEAQNGMEAISLATSRKPDVIVLDLGLPDINGVEVAVLLKQDHKTFSIPIVVLTAWAPEVWRDRAMKAGAARYMTKPCPPAMLKSTIEEVLRNGADSNRDLSSGSGSWGNYDSLNPYGNR